MDAGALIKKHMWLIVLIAIVLSFSVPQVGLVFEPYVLYLLMILMFFSYLNIDLKQVLKHFSSVADELTTLAIIHLAAIPVVLLIKPFLSDELFLGLFLAATVSSGVSVVFLSDLYGGKASQALVITVISNLFIPITLPLLMLLFTKTSIAIDFVSMSITLLNLVVIPFVLAMIARKLTLDSYFKKSGTYISVGLLFVIILGIVSPLQEMILRYAWQSLLLLIVISGMITCNFFLGYAIGKKRKDKIAYALSASYKNYALSTVTAFSFFGPLAALPAVIYAFASNILLIPLQLVVLRKK